MSGAGCPDRCRYPIRPRCRHRQGFGAEATQQNPELFWQSAVEADVTVTFACPKLGLVIDADTELYTGAIVVADIGIPQRRDM